MDFTTVLRQTKRIWYGKRSTSLMALCESVGARLRERNCLCSTVALGIRDNRLLSYDRQAKLNRPTANTLDIWETAVELFRRHHAGREPTRGLPDRRKTFAPSAGCQSGIAGMKRSHGIARAGGLCR